MRLRQFVPAIATALLLPASAFGCTLCHTDLAQEVRAAVLGNDLWQNAGISVLPVLLIASIALFIQDGGKRK